MLKQSCTLLLYVEAYESV